jgi:hypothetical protein
MWEGKIYPLSLLQNSLFRHSRESGNLELLEKPGFRVALRSEHHGVQGFACEAWSVGRWNRLIFSSKLETGENF